MRKVIVITAVALVCSLSATAQTTENMDRIEVCKQNYRTLFGGEALTGQGTDPEMMDILQKFIFGEVFQTGELTLKQREMITCITLATMQTLPQLKAHAGAALNVGVTPEELREVMYLTAPFIGFPRMLKRYRLCNGGCARRYGQGCGAVPDRLFLRRYLQPRCTRPADPRAARLLRPDHPGSREPAPLPLSRQHQRRQHTRNPA